MPWLDAQLLSCRLGDLTQAPRRYVFDKLAVVNLKQEILAVVIELQLRKQGLYHHPDIPVRDRTNVLSK